MSDESDCEQYMPAAAIEMSATPAYQTDLDGKFIRWNNAANKAYGYTADEIAGKKNSILYPLECRYKEARISEQISHSQDVNQYESIRIGKDGSRLSVLVSASPVINREGKIVAVSKFERELGEQPGFNALLNPNPEIQNTLLSEIEAFYHTAPVGLCFIDNNLRYVRVNKRLADLNGVSAEAHLGRTVREILPATLADQVETLLQNILLTGEPALNIEISGETAGLPGVIRFWILNYYPLIDSSGEILGIYAIVQEITEKKQAEETISLSGRRLHHLIDSFFSFVGMLSPDGSVIDMSGTIVSANPKIKEFVGKNFADLSWWDWSEDVREKIQVSLARCAQGETIHYDTVARDEENQFLIFDFRLKPVIDEKGKIILLISSGINIGEHFKLGADSAHSWRAPFTDELAAGLAHEIKNPLAGIQGAIDLLIRRQTPDNFEYQILETIRQEIHRINDVLQVLLRRASPHLMCIGNSSLMETVKSVVRLTEHLILGRKLEDKIKIKLDLPSDSIVMSYDEAKIKDALLNLLINAVDAIGEKPGIIKVRLSRAESVTNNYQAVIDIFNSGSFISKAELPKIFAPFYTTKKNGNGFGLSSVKRIAAAHGGYCTVKSFRNKGTTFSLHLPVESGAFPAEALSASRNIK